MLEAIFRTTDSAEQIRVTQHAHDNGTLVAMSFVATASIMKAVLAAARAQKRHQYVRLNHTDVSLSQAGYHILSVKGKSPEGAEWFVISNIGPKSAARAGR